MNLEIKKNFLEKWEKHFPGSELPIVFQYADEIMDIRFPNKPKPNPRGYTCIFSQLAPVRRGHACAFNAENLGCFGAIRNLGFSNGQMTDEIMDYLINVERFKKTREQVERLYESHPDIQAPGRYIVVKRWDELVESDEPQVVIFFCNPDAIGWAACIGKF